MNGIATGVSMQLLHTGRRGVKVSSWLSADVKSTQAVSVSMRMSPEEVAAVSGPVLLGYILNSEQALAVLLVLVLLCKDGQPRQHCPQAILLSDMVAASTEGLLPTHRALTCMCVYVVQFQL